MFSRENKIELSESAVRVLGVLIEKEKTTPDYYPMTLNALISGCNQSTNRNPVVNYTEIDIERALSELRDKSLALRGVYAGSRVPKHRHNLEKLDLSLGGLAVLAVLLLRGPQTLGELKQRSERIFSFDDVEQCQQAVDELIEHEFGLAARMERVPGQKEIRIRHQLSLPVTDKTLGSGESGERPTLQLVHDVDQDHDEDLVLRVERLEKEVTVLVNEIMKLRSEIDELGKD